MAVRQAGLQQVAGWPKDLKGFATWPAPGQTAVITLAGAQWALVLTALRHWAAVEDRGDDPEGGARLRTLADALRADLG